MVTRIIWKEQRFWQTRCFSFDRKRTLWWKVFWEHRVFFPQDLHGKSRVFPSGSLYAVCLRSWRFYQHLPAYVLFSTQPRYQGRGFLKLEMVLQKEPGHRFGWNLEGVVVVLLLLLVVVVVVVVVIVVASFWRRLFFRLSGLSVSGLDFCSCIAFFGTSAHWKGIPLQVVWPPRRFWHAKTYRVFGSLLVVTWWLRGKFCKRIFWLGFFHGEILCWEAIPLCRILRHWFQALISDGMVFNEATK